MLVDNFGIGWEFVKFVQSGLESTKKKPSVGENDQLNNLEIFGILLLKSHGYHVALVEKWLRMRI